MLKKSLIFTLVALFIVGSLSVYALARSSGDNYRENLNREVKKIDDGLVVTITSNDPQVVKRLHRRADLFEKRKKESEEDILSPYLKGYLRGYCDSEIDHLGTGRMERGMHMMMGGW